MILECDFKVGVHFIVFQLMSNVCDFKVAMTIHGKVAYQLIIPQFLSTSSNLFVCLFVCFINGQILLNKDGIMINFNGFIIDKNIFHGWVT